MGPARFERRPTIVKHREIMVGRRGEAPLVPPYTSPCFNKAMALGFALVRLRVHCGASIVADGKYFGREIFGESC